MAAATPETMAAMSKPESADYRTGWIFVAANAEYPVPEDSLRFCTLRNTILSLYKDDLKTTPQDPTQVIENVDLDHCQVQPLPLEVHPSKTFDVSTALMLQSLSAKTVFRGQTVCYLFFKTSLEKEEWFHALSRATLMNDAEFRKWDEVNRKAIFNHFSELLQHTNLHEGPVSASWINVLAARCFWNVFDRKDILDVMRSKLDRALSSIKFPPPLHAIRLGEIGLGPNLPEIRSVELLSVTAEGAVDLNMEFEYRGGAHVQVLPATSIVDVNITVHIHVVRLAGKIKIHIGGPHSQRYWLGFHTPPEIELDINTSVLGTPEFDVPFVANVVEKKIKEQVMTPFVMPNLDDSILPGGSSERSLLHDLMQRDEERAKVLKKEAKKAGLQDANKPGFFQRMAHRMMHHSGKPPEECPECLGEPRSEEVRVALRAREEAKQLAEEERKQIAEEKRAREAAAEASQTAAEKTADIHMAKLLAEAQAQEAVRNALIAAGQKETEKAGIDAREGFPLPPAPEPQRAEARVTPAPSPAESEPSAVSAGFASLAALPPAAMGPGLAGMANTIGEYMSLTENQPAALASGFDGKAIAALNTEEKERARRENAEREQAEGYVPTYSPHAGIGG